MNAVQALLFLGALLVLGVDATPGTDRGHELSADEVQDPVSCEIFFRNWWTNRATPTPTPAAPPCAMDEDVVCNDIHCCL